jgi:hypothetical protein
MLQRDKEGGKHTGLRPARLPPTRCFYGGVLGMSASVRTFDAAAGWPWLPSCFLVALAAATGSN